MEQENGVMTQAIAGLLSEVVICAVTALALLPALYTLHDWAVLPATVPYWQVALAVYGLRRVHGAKQ